MSDERYLVTGAGGFVGGFVVRELLQRGVNVRAMVRNRDRLGDLKGLDVEVVEGDLTDQPSLDAAVQGIRGVYHIAALFREAGHPESVFYDVNAAGVRRLFDAAVAAGVQRIVHCSTVGVLGHVEEPPADETTPYNPGDMYQRTKMAGEEIALGYFASGAMRGVVIRPGMIYGPGDARTLKLFRMIARGKFFYVGKGDALVHWVDVRDLARSFVLAMERSGLHNAVYIIAGERAVPLREMAAEIANQLGVKPPWLTLPVKPMQWLGSACEAVCRPLGVEPPIFRRRVDFFTKDRHFDTAKARNELGFAPAQSLAEEISDILQDYRSKGLL